MREPGIVQGMVLVSLAWVSTVAAVVIAPVLPTIKQAFIDVPGVDLKIPLVATGPSLLVALLAIPYGFLADRIGRRTLLLWALALYGVAGMAPLLLAHLDTIVISRLVVGLAEAAIMTCGTALISDYFQGRRRELWLAAQAGTSSASAVVLAILGGALGAFGWRTPFYVYTWGFMLIPLVLWCLWEPQRSRPEPAPDDVEISFSWAKPLRIALVIVFSMTAFMVTVVQFSFVVTERGMISPQTIGLWSAFVTVANPLGSLLYVVWKGRTAGNLVIAYGVFTIGFLVMSLVPTVPAAITGSFVANLGAGFMFPTAITWLLSTIPAPLRGRGAGLWTSAVFLGQFLGPLVIVGLEKITGTLSHAILCMGVACTVAALIATPAALKRPAGSSMGR